LGLKGDEQVTIRTWNADQGAYADRQITRLESLTLFLTAVREQFEQPAEFNRALGEFIREVQRAEG